MVGPDYHPPIPDAPNEWKNAEAQNEGYPDVEKWWDVFFDDKLDELESIAITNNRDLFAAFERVQEARAYTGIVGADLYPHFSLDPVYNNQGVLIKLFGMTPPAFIRAHEMLYQLPINLSYQLDLWGRLQDQYYSAKYQWQSQIEDYNLVLLSLTTDLASFYFQLRTADSQIDLLTNTIKTREKAFTINQARYDAKIVNYSDVSRAGLEVDNARTQYQEIQRQRANLENRIAVLIGVNPSEFSIEHLPLKDAPPSIPAGIPSTVLLQRPDIASLERQMAAAHALVKAAYASFFPSFEITGGAGYLSPVLSLFLKNKSRWWMYGASMDQTLFDGFRKTNNLYLQWSTFKEIGYEYQQQVFLALEEVENSLSDIQRFALEFISSEGSVKWARKTTQIARDRYFQGVTFYLDVMDSERDQLNAEIISNNLLGQQYLATIHLIRAIGGTWSHCED